MHEIETTFAKAHSVDPFNDSSSDVARFLKTEHDVRFKKREGDMKKD